MSFFFISVGVGDFVKEDEIIAEIETDKVVYLLYHDSYCIYIYLYTNVFNQISY